MPQSTKWRMVALFIAVLYISYLFADRVIAQNVSQYCYDAQGRLIAVKQGEGVTSSCAFDTASNRAQVGVTLQFINARVATSPYIGHDVGRNEADGWSDRVEDPEGHMIFGPYTNGVTVGNHVAAFRILVAREVARFV